jgi:hypothetical protein
MRKRPLIRKAFMETASQRRGLLKKYGFGGRTLVLVPSPGYGNAAPMSWNRDRNMRTGRDGGIGMPARLTKNSVGIIIASLVSLWWVGTFFAYQNASMNRVGSYAPDLFGLFGLFILDVFAGAMGFAFYVALSEKLPEKTQAKIL